MRLHALLSDDFPDPLSKTIYRHVVPPASLGVRNPKLISSPAANVPNVLWADDRDRFGPRGDGIHSRAGAISCGKR